MLIGNNFICLFTNVFLNLHMVLMPCSRRCTCLQILSYTVSIVFLASSSFPSQIACFCWKWRSCFSNSEILSSALCFSSWKSSLSKHKCECNSEHCDVSLVRSSCTCEIETCKTGKFSQMKLVGLAFCFGFLATSLPSEFLCTSSVLGKIKGSLYQPI